MLSETNMHFCLRKSCETFSKIALFRIKLQSQLNLLACNLQTTSASNAPCLGPGRNFLLHFIIKVIYNIKLITASAWSSP